MNAAKRVAQAVVLFLALLALVSVPVQAQTSNGTLVGSVTDPTGAVVTNAAVSAVSSQYGQTHVTHTDSVGTYRLESLQPGVYSVTINASGFETLTINGVVINGSLTTTINGKVAIATAQQTIEVQAGAAQVIDTQSGQLGESISRQEIAELPYGSDDPTELIMTLPGVHDTPQGQGAVNTNLTEGQEFSVNGTRPRSNNFLIDGQDNNDSGITGEAYQPTNYGAIQEVTFLTNAYTAEYGRGGGSVTNVIYKSGTNNFHGDLWEENRNSALAAIPAQDQVTNPLTKNPYDNENTFGFDVGGPVVKDKLFVFGAAQWDREHQAATGPLGFNLPTPAGIATLKSLEPNANISLFLTAIGSLVGTSTNPATLVPLGNGRPSVEVGPFQFQGVETISGAYDWNYRMDWHFTNNDVLTGSIIREHSSLSPDNFANPNALPNFQTEQSGHSDLVRGQWAHTISSTLVNEFRLSYSNITFGFFLTPATSAGPQANLPWIEFGNDFNLPAIGVDSDFPQQRSHNTYQIQDALSYSANRHTIKAGADITILNVRDVIALNQRGTLFYNSGGSFSGGTFSSLANFIDDTSGSNPGDVSKGFGNPDYNTHANMFSLFIEDTWRIRNDLTLTGGLRYEYWGTLANSLAFPAFNIGAGVGLPNATDPSYSTNLATFESLFSFKQVPDKRNFAPRLGLAYTPHWAKFLFGDGKTVFRAGYGIFYDGLFSNLPENSAGSQPNTFGGNLPFQSGRGIPNASTFPNLGPTTFDSAFFNESMASNLHNPLTEQWNVDVQRELPLGLVMTLAYVGTRGDRLFANQDFNPALGLNSNTFNYDYTNPNFGEFGIRTNDAQSWYSSAQVEVERKLRNLNLRASYTYSKFMDDASEIFELGTTTTVGLSSYPQVLTNQYSDWGPSAFDQRHRFSVSYVWQVPFSRRNSFLRALTDQWEWSSIATIESGTPNTVEDGFDNNFNGHANSRPDLENPNAPLSAIGIDGGNIYINQLLTPGLFYDFNCALFTAGPCTPKPETDYHFIVPAQIINAAGDYVAPPGNVGRNSIHGPGQIYFDTAVERDFPIHFWKVEGQKLTLRMEMFNAFNHPNLFTPSYTLTDSNFDNTAITITGGRQIKLWLRYSF